jgi:excisionase family DNA binding protein
MAEENVKPIAYTTVKEVAKQLDLSEVTVRRHVKSGEIPSRKIGGAVRIPTSVINPPPDKE